MRTKTFLYPTFRFLAHHRSPQLTARLLVLSLRQLRAPSQRPENAGSSHRALIFNLNKPGFWEDIEETFRGNESFELVCWPNYALKAFSAALLSPSLNNKRYISNDPTVEATKVAYREFLAQTWKHFCKAKPVDVVLSANFGYYAQHEFATVVERAGTPFIVLHKENVRSPRRVKFWHSIYRSRGAFTGRKILVYNAIERDLQISSGIVEPDKILVTGMPRLDRVHKWRREHAGKSPEPTKRQVLFFSFWRKEKLTATRPKRSSKLPNDMQELEREWSQLSWDRLSQGTHRAIVELARKRPDISFVIKAKGQTRKLNDILEMLKGTGESLPSNLRVVAGGDPFNLIAQSHVVVGFNTTALLEALAAGRPVIVPSFGEASDAEMEGLIIDLGDAVSYASSPENLQTLICNHAELSTEVPFDLTSKIARTLTYWVGNDDGAAGHRVLEAVYEEISADKL